MKKIAAILVIALAALQARADVRLFAWQESRDAKTGEKQFGFYLAPRSVMKFMEADAKGDRKTAGSLGAGLPKDAWAYGLLLTRESGSYSKEKIALFESGPCGSVIEIASGSVEVDWNAETVHVGLKVIQDRKPIDFRGNGSYRIRKNPNPVVTANSAVGHASCERTRRARRPPGRPLTLSNEPGQDGRPGCILL